MERVSPTCQIADVYVDDLRNRLDKLTFKKPHAEEQLNSAADLMAPTSALALRQKRS